MFEQIDRMTAREILRGDEDRAAAIIGKVRAAERARILAAMRQPDAAMVEAVAKAIWGDEPGADEYWTAFEDHANRALAAAADHMEAGHG